MAAAFGLLEAFGVFTGGLGIFSFVQHNFIDYKPQGAGYRFAVGLDGAGPWDNPLSNAGGNLPDIRAFNELGDLLGTTINDKSYCSSGRTDCDSVVDDVHDQPTYTLFSANNDAICLAYATVTFPEGAKYAWTGNWAKHCGAPWYYSDIYVQNNMGADKVLCAWMDGNGDQPITGIQVHWPDYDAGFRGNGNNPDFYCHHPSALTFHRDHDPWRVHVRPSKRNMFASDPSTETKRVAGAPKDDAKKSTEGKHTEGLTERMARDTRLIKSKATSHLATELCASPDSVGPSFVSYHERKFCHMAPKHIYSFCEDVKQGDCWDDAKHEIVHKSEDGPVKRAAVPAVAFNQTLLWGQ
ncbi:hypothetical protein E4U19_002749 [Claviceps sp. Clav32 group G5]|nr:hypothetical protein E4U19_002749 [Claviceps sp. Clav32 group G5]